MIAMALACEPQLLIADEPTTALDVTIQAQILDLSDASKRADRHGRLLITHDLGVVAEHAHHVAVMYAGKVVEQAPTAATSSAPRTRTRRASSSRCRRNAKGGPLGRAATIRGVVPNPLRLPTGCRFRTRCPLVVDDCKRSSRRSRSSPSRRGLPRVERGEIALFSSRGPRAAGGGATPSPFVHVVRPT
jgi:ABC-type dipeptide/oligopeptide/nickel transport system ATPase component